MSSLSDSSAIVVEAVTQLEQLQRYSAEWDRLVFHSTRWRPQASFAYVAAQLEHLQDPSAKWACLVATRAGVLMGVLPFLIVGIGAARLVLHLKANILEADLVVAEGQEDNVIPALLKNISRVAPGWVSLKFGDLQEHSPMVQYSNSARGLILNKAIGCSSFIRLQGTFESYLDGLSGSFRRNLRRVSKKFFSLPGAVAEFIGPEEANRGHLAAFVTVEGSGWKARDGNAVCRRSELEAYYQAVTERLACNGALRWHILRVGDRVVAVNLVVKMGSKLAISKIGYDETWSEYAPGNILIAQTIERAYSSDDVEEVDFLSDHEWNRRWQAETRDCYEITVFNKSLAGVALGYLPTVARRKLGSSHRLRRVRDRIEELRGSFATRARIRN